MKVHESARPTPAVSDAPSQIEVLLSRFQRPTRTAQPVENPSGALTTKHRADKAGRRSGSVPETAPVDALRLLPDLAAGGLPARVRAAVSAYPYGAPLPPAKGLARELDGGLTPVAKELAALEVSGEIATSRGRRSGYRLRPDELHPQDVAFDRAVREGISSGLYAPGMPLPTGLLGSRHHVSTVCVPRALRLLLAERKVLRRDGTAGPGYYVTTPPGAAPVAAASAAREGRPRG
ncbi:hypothetical protein ACFY2N_34415 [Streptomyces rubiginosohelvolus]|uniref:hypothetical protein n=1 Tax=Streptomyces rubiginosohelvolus TaxID=67362 RepID=UPI0036AEE83C